MGTSSRDQNGIVEIYDLQEIKKHSTADDCWVVHGKNVYDISSFLSKHPGGADVILREAGNDVTAVLRDENIHVHTTSAYNILKEYKIGETGIPSAEEDLLDINSNQLVGWKEETVDWDRGMVFQVHKFGREYIKWVHSPVNRSLRLFDSEFIEFFSNTPWYLIIILWLPVVIIAAAHSYRELATNLHGGLVLFDSWALFATLLLFFGGILLWTLIEYFLHRYVFHFEPDGDSPSQITLHFFFHGLHHKVPFDGGRLVFPPCLAAFFVVAFWCVLGRFCLGGIRTGLFSGGIFGYICYDMIHYYIHHGNPMEDSYLYALKRYHVAHHFEDPTNGFGISSKFWDVVFDTRGEKRKQI